MPKNNKLKNAKNETRNFELEINEFSRNYQATLDLLQRSSDKNELLDAIFDEYILRLDELKDIDLSTLDDNPGLVDEKAKFKSLVRFATQASVVHDKARLYQKLDKANRELRIANGQLDNKNKQLAALNEHYLSMLSFASHELRSPLISILGYAELLADGIMGELNAEQDDAVDVIIRVAKTLIDMIRNYLDLTRIETGEMALKKKLKQIDILSEVIEPILFEMSEQFNKKQMTVTTDYTKAVRAEVDRNLIRIVFSNLFSNAVRYGAAGTSVTSHIQDNSDYYTFSITNRGIGVKPDKVKKIFEKFTQAPESQQIDTTKGTGLGLFISKKIIEEHGGQIWAETKFGEEFTVAFVLPKKKDRSIAVHVHQDQAADAVEKAEHYSLTSGS